MSIETRCPNTKCDARLLVSEDKVDKITRCSKCGMRFKITRGIGIPLFGSPSRSTNGSEPQQDARAVMQRQDRVAQSAQPAPAETTQHDARKTEADGLAGKPFVAKPGKDALDATQPAERPELSQTILAEPAAPSKKDEGRPLGVATQGGSQKQEEIRSAEDAVPPAWAVGDVILDTYEVRRLTDSLDYAEGGFGRVYRVHHRGWNMDLAVKSPRADKFQSEQQKQNFIAECETWIKLGLHPNIVSCNYVRLLGGIPRVFAEFVEGGSLEDWINDKRLYKGGPTEALKRILDIAIQFAWGLHYAHGKSLVHQDVKPHNVMVTADGEAKVTDFGLARARAAVDDPGGAGGRGQSCKVAGAGFMTKEYASPEQVEGRPLTRKTDIWSWAVSVYEMFVGELTWRSGLAVPELLEEYVKSGPVAEGLPKMPGAIVDILRSCLQRDPGDRPKDMINVADRLKETYEKGTPQEYPREVPKAVDLLADGLNNQAVSMLDLGRKQNAQELLDQAIQVDPHHPESTYNRGLLLWRSGRMADDELILQLEEIRSGRQNDWGTEYLLGLVQMERGDMESAGSVLEKALAQSGDDPRVTAALSDVRSRQDMDVCRVGALKRHIGGGGRRSVAISKDWRFVLSRDLDNTLRFWELSTGECLRMFQVRTAGDCVTISPCGRFGLSGEQSTLHLWDLNTGECVQTLEGHTNKVVSVAISPDSRLALSGSLDTTLRLWDLVTGKCVRTLKGHTNCVTAVAISQDGRLALSGSSGGPDLESTLRLWDLTTGECVKTFDGYTYLVASVDISPDGRWGLSGGLDSLLLWELATGMCVRSFHGHADAVGSVAISANGLFALSGSQDRTLRQWELTTGKCMRTFKGPMFNFGAVALAVSPDSLWGLAVDSCVGGADKTLILCDLRTGRKQPFVIVRPASAGTLIGQAREAERQRQAGVEALREGDIEAALARLRAARGIAGLERAPALLSLWCKTGLRARRSGLRRGWAVRQFRGHIIGEVASVAISPDGRFALSGADDGLRQWELDTGTCLRTLKHTRRRDAVAISPDGRFVLAGGTGNTLYLWELTTGKQLRTFEGHTDWVGSVSISRDGYLGLSVDKGGGVRLWELATGKCLRTHNLMGHVKAVAISPDGRFVLAGGTDKTLCLWELTTGKQLRTFVGHTDRVDSVSISRDGYLGLSVDMGGGVRLWELATGKCLRMFEQTARVSAVAISSDRRFALSAGRDNKVRLWELATGKCQGSFVGHTDAVICIAISPDNRFALSGSRDRTLCLWELDWEYEFPGWSDWDDGAAPYLRGLLTLHCPYGEDGVSRVGKPVWDEEDFQALLVDLQYGGYGWLRPEGVRRKLEEMTVNWNGQPPLPWETTGASRLAKEDVKDLSEPGFAATVPPGGRIAARSTGQKPHGESLRSRQAARVDMNCPKCGSDHYKPVCLGGRRVHKTCSCGAGNPPANTFCVACGKRLPDTGPMTCPNCGQLVPSGVRFCVNCGKEIGSQ